MGEEISGAGFTAAKALKLLLETMELKP